MRITIDAEPTEVAALFRQTAVAQDGPVAAGLTAEDVRNIVHEDYAHFLRDIEFRVAQAYDVERRSGRALTDTGSGKVYAEDLNLLRHQITGYTVTANSPSAGSIAWASVHIVYNGTDYAITDGNTASRYAWFDPAVSTTTLQTSDTKPTLTAQACLVFVNNNGTPTDALTSSIPAAVGDGAVDSNAILAGAVSSTALATGAVTAGKIGSGAVDSTALASGAVTSGKIGAGAVGSSAIAGSAVGSTQLASGAVTAGKIGTGAVDSTALASGAVTSGKIGASAVDSSALASGAVTAGKIGTGAVDATALASGAVTAGKIASGAVGSAELGSGAVQTSNLAAGAVDANALATGAVTAGKVGAAAITAQKLNLLMHTIY